MTTESVSDMDRTDPDGADPWPVLEPTYSPPPAVEGGTEFVGKGMPAPEPASADRISRT